jgi:hypothetical protein
VRGKSLAWLGLFAVTAAPLAAQTVELRLREEGSGTPIAGAIVRLLREQAAVAQALSSEVGRVVLRAPGPGTYRLKVDRIGWSGTLTAPFELGADETLRREIAIVPKRTELPELTVRGRSECTTEAQGGSLATALWEEIRKALTANLITQRGKAVPLHVREFVREVDRAGRIRREWVVASTLMRGQPFRTYPPADLRQQGFVRAEKDGTLYAAPDAVLLLSDEFVATHCFRVVPGSGGLIGLAFEPASRRSVTEVRGTLWVDRPSSELKFLEYTYVGDFQGELEQAKLGGRIELRRLPTGPWIISYWHIRMPRLEVSEIRGVGNIPQSVVRLIGYEDRGGRADVAVDSLGIVNRALVMGRIYDSVAGRGLEGVVVKLRGSWDSVLSDSAGRFVLAAHGSGDQVITARHPKLGLLGEPVKREMLLSLGDSVTVQFAIPPLDAFVKRLCGPTPRGRSGLIGIKWGSDGLPAEELQVRVVFNTSTRGIREERSRDSPLGLYALCDLPADRALPAGLFDGPRPLAQQTIRLEYGKFSWVDFRAP